MNSSNDRLDRIEAILAATAIQQQANTVALDRLDRVDRIAVQQQANTLGDRATGSSNQRQHRSQ